MSTDALILEPWGNDSPWRRLPWTLPAAVLVWFAVLWAFTYFLGKPSERLPEPPAIEAQVIELPAPPPPEAKPLTPVKPVEPRQPKTIRPTPVQQPRIEKNPSPVREASPVAAPTVPMAPPPPARVEPSPPNANLAGTSGARAIVRPMPQIPDELRQDALSTAAVARFRVAVDGTATVDLIKPTSNPRLNRLLLDTLKNWRFFPAMKDGKPVATTEEIVIKVEVK